MMREGVVEKPSQKTGEEICKWLPAELYPFVESAAVHYRIEATRGVRAPKPRKVRSALEKIADQAAALHVSLGTMSEEVRSALLDTLPGETSGMLESLDRHSGWLMGAARNAALDVDAPDGRPTGPEYELVRRLVNVMEGHGIQPKRGPNGSLARVTEALLKNYDVQRADVPRMVRRALPKT